MLHAIPTPNRTRLDGIRIAAGAGAIALNLAVLMLLLRPISPPAWLQQAIRAPDIVWIEPERPRPVPPLPVPVEQPRPQPRPVAVAQPRLELEPVPIPVVAPQPGDLAIPPVEAVAVTGGADAIAAPTGPLAGARLQYAKAPPPPYPRRAVREGRTGTVLLEVLVDTDGRPLEVRIAQSSGHQDLDRAARRQVLEQWRFAPALDDGRPVQAIGLVPVAFSLER